MSSISALKKIAPIVVLALICAGCLIVWSFHIDLTQLKNMLADLKATRDQAPILFAAEFFVLYVTITALCIPVEVLMAIASGALFGWAEGTVIASFSSSIGATLAFCGARSLLRETVSRHLAQHMAKVDTGVARDGNLYLLSLCLLPIFPFGLANILMGLTKMSPMRFYIISLVGLLPALMIYTNAGTALATIGSLAQILSWRLVLSLLALSVLPWAAKAIITTWRKRKLKMKQV